VTRAGLEKGPGQTGAVEGGDTRILREVWGSINMKKNGVNVKKIGARAEIPKRKAEGTKSHLSFEGSGRPSKCKSLPLTLKKTKKKQPKNEKSRRGGCVWGEGGW